MSRQQLIVLKFGGSVLRSVDDLYVATQEIYRWYRNGHQVIAIVSALYGKTDQLYRQASQFNDASPHSIAKLVSCGELESAALLGMTLDQCGLPNAVLLESETQLRTCGHPLDAMPLSLDIDLIRQVLKEYPVVVMPGFVGRDAQGQVNLLGRGGSDFTALFVAQTMNADRCRLIKDVDGLYEFDPQHDSAVAKPRRYLSLTYDAALTLDESILQPKAIRFARERNLEFEVSCILGHSSTTIGSRDVVYANDTPIEPLRVGLLGLGAVGRGVFEQLNRLSIYFQIESVAVRDVSKHSGYLERTGSPQNLLTTEWAEVLDGDCGVVIELMGGLDPALHVVNAAWNRGKTVVTANKSLLASKAFEEQLANSVLKIKGHHTRSYPIRPPQLLFTSAAVGGNVPMLESVARIAREKTIKRLRGILNGTTNYVLDEVAAGRPVAEAIQQAQQLGLAEADPSRDLTGLDAAEKLVLLCQAIGFTLDLKDVEIQSELWQALNELVCVLGETQTTGESDISSNVKPGGRSYRQIASAEIDHGSITASVTLRPLDSSPDDQHFQRTFRQENVLVVETTDGERFVCRGLGAGRWATAISVVADLVDILHSQVELATVGVHKDQGVQAVFQEVLAEA